MVDREGFPRSDIDVHAARILINQVHRTSVAQGSTVAVSAVW
jgi:hypothetical protein